jgi:uncharacterized protein YodC (DUF2158 family)
MDVKPGDVVVLKSGGQALTVAEVNDRDAGCVWIGDSGDLFRETLPLVVLERAEIELVEDEETEGEHESGDEEEEDVGEGERHIA